MAATEPRDAPAVPQADLDRRRDALQRYRRVAAELAEAERRNPEVALRLERVVNDAYLRSAAQVIDGLLDALNEATARARDLHGRLDAAEREMQALRAVIAGQANTIKRLHRRLPRWQQATLTPAEVFIATHAIADVIGQVVPLTPRENGHRRYLAGTCPFCAQTSLVVHEYHAQFSCYSCGKGGTVLDFLRLLAEKGAA